MRASSSSTRSLSSFMPVTSFRGGESHALCAGTRSSKRKGAANDDLPPGPELEPEEPADVSGEHVKRAALAAIDPRVTGHRGLDEPRRIRELDRRLHDPATLLHGFHRLGA